MIPSLCLELLDPARSWPERVALAARAGYRAIESWDWRGRDLAALRRAADDLGLGVAPFSANRACGAAHPAHRAGFLDEARRAVEVAARLGSRPPDGPGRPPGCRRPGASRATARGPRRAWPASPGRWLPPRRRRGERA